MNSSPLPAATDLASPPLPSPRARTAPQLTSGASIPPEPFLATTRRISLPAPDGPRRSCRSRRRRRFRGADGRGRPEGGRRRRLQAQAGLLPVRVLPPPPLRPGLVLRLWPFELPRGGQVLRSHPGRAGGRRRRRERERERRLRGPFRHAPQRGSRGGQPPVRGPAGPHHREREPGHVLHRRALHGVPDAPGGRRG